MNRTSDLALYEEILLLALGDEKGTITTGAMYPYALGGAVLAELLLRNNITVKSSGKKKLVEVADPTPTGSPLLDECIVRIRESKKEASVQTWLTRFANLKNLKHRVAERLCDRGVLKADEDKVLFFFTRRIYPENAHGPEEELIHRMRDAVLNNEETIDARTVVIISLAKSAAMLKPVFDRKELKAHKDRLESIVKGECIGEAARQAIEAVEAAVLIAAIMPAIIASTTTTH